MNIKPEDQLLYLCARQSFLETHQKALFDICSENNIDWENIFSTAELHGVAPLVYTNLRKCRDLDIPPTISEQFKTSLMRTIALKINFENNIIRAITFFNKRSIRIMLLKGAALDVVVYDQPYYTIYSDVDLALDIKQEKISNQQYREFMDYFYRRNLEFDFFSHHDVTMNNVLPVNFQQIWDCASKVKFRDQEIFVMSPEDMLLSLCINSCRKRFFRLKAICDIAETVVRYPNLDWDIFVQRAIAYDCGFIVYTALSVVKMTVGCSVPDEVFSKLKVHPVRAKIINYLIRRLSLSSFSSLYSGNHLFGRSIEMPLLLSYATFHPYQVWRRFLFVFQYSERGTLRNNG